MKRFALVISALLLFNIGNAQFLRFGLKGGVSSTKVRFSDKTIENLSTSQGVKDYIIEQGDAKMGYHFGLFARIQVLGVFIQPELLFTHSQGEVVLNDVTANQVFNEVQRFNKVDIPVIVGTKLGPFRIGVGPVASFMLSESDGLKDRFDALTSEVVDNRFKKATFGYQVGVGVDILSKLTLDVRYEGNLSKLGEGITLGGTNYSFDQRNPQVVFSVGLFF